MTLIQDQWNAGAAWLRVRVVERVPDGYVPVPPALISGQCERMLMCRAMIDLKEEDE